MPLRRLSAAMIILPTALLTGFTVGATPARAQGAISHDTVYLPVPADHPAVPRTNLPHLDPRQLPLSALRRNNALPAGAHAPKAGVTPGRSDAAAPETVAPSAYGGASPLSIAPYTTARASADKLGSTKTAAEVGVTSYPWRPTGELSFYIGSTEYVCSASMIRRGILITAAHCVYEFGNGTSAGWHTNYVFTPAMVDGATAPLYKTWQFKSETISKSYYNGTDSCVTTGVACNNDLALVIVAPQAGKYPGDYTGWYGYGWNGYSYVASFGGASLASITQLGYPVAFDAGKMMERNDGIGAYYNSGGVLNTVIGTALTGGSSGGPWLVNFGASPSLSAQATLGNASSTNVIVGVTSWGYTTVGNNTQGASFFGQNTEWPNQSYTDSSGVNRGAGNIGGLLSIVCNAAPAACK